MSKPYPSQTDPSILLSSSVTDSLPSFSSVIVSSEAATFVVVSSVPGSLVMIPVAVVS